MNRKLRNKCVAEITDCIHVRFEGKSEGIGYIRKDDGVLHDFLAFCIKRKIYSINPGGSVGGGFYAFCHRKEDREQIREFFTAEKIPITEFQT